MTAMAQASKPKTSRRRSREFAMQGLYQWQLAGADAASIERDMSQAKGFEKLDREYFSTLLAGAIRHAPQLEAALEPLLDRKCEIGRAHV